MAGKRVEENWRRGGAPSVPSEHWQIITGAPTDAHSTTKAPRQGSLLVSPLFLKDVLSTECMAGTTVRAGYDEVSRTQSLPIPSGLMSAGTLTSVSCRSRQHRGQRRDCPGAGSHPLDGL